jgi:hypothetical protein
VFEWLSLSELMLLQIFTDTDPAHDFNMILALWARSLMWQQQQQQASSATSPTSDALRTVRRLLVVARPAEDDIVFVWGFDIFHPEAAHSVLRSEVMLRQGDWAGLQQRAIQASLSTRLWFFDFSPYFVSAQKRNFSKCEAWILLGQWCAAAAHEHQQQWHASVSQG